MRSWIPIALIACACGKGKGNDKPPSAKPPAPAAAAATASVAPKTATPASRASSIALPGAGSEAVALDYLVFDPHTSTIWVPAAGTGTVDVIDTATRKVHPIEGFPTRAAQIDNTTRRLGPSSAAVGDGVVYIGNRADRSVCAVDEVTFQRGRCTTLNEDPDALTYAPTTKQVWVTTPRDNSIRVLDADTLSQTARIELAGAPEGFAMDAPSGRFYTNLEDRNQTLVIDVATRQTIATFTPECGEAGPRSLRVDPDVGLLFVACTSKVEALSLHNAGQIVGSVDAGEGVDDFDYDRTRHLLFIGASKAGKLTIADVAGSGALTVREVITTAPGARNGVVDANGVVYLAHGTGAELLVVDTRS